MPIGINQNQINKNILEDNFTGDSLSPEWVVQNEVGGTITVADGYLEISDVSGGSVTGGIQILRYLPVEISSNVSITVHVENINLIASVQCGIWLLSDESSVASYVPTGRRINAHLARSPGNANEFWTGDNITGYTFDSHAGTATWIKLINYTTVYVSSYYDAPHTSPPVPGSFSIKRKRDYLALPNWNRIFLNVESFGAGTATFRIRSLKVELL